MEIAPVNAASEKPSCESSREITAGVSFQRAVYAVLRILAGPLICALSQYRYEPYRPKSKVFLFLSNHTSDLDPFYGVICLGRHMRFVASENITRGLPGFFVKTLAGPIPRKKGASADRTVSLIEENLRCGVSVAMFPEGNRCWDGETGFIPPRTASILKNAPNCALITYRIDGGYLRSPRWAVRSRRGPQFGRVIQEYDAKQLAALTEEEIYGIIRRDLYTDAYAVQRKGMKKYRGRDLAEGLENALYVCPRCKSVGSFSSHGDEASCALCGCTVKYDEYGFLHGDGIRFDNVLDWSCWQKRWLFENAARLSALTDTPFASDFGVELRRDDGDGAKTVFESCRLDVYGDRLEAVCGDEHETLSFKGISRMGAFRNTRLFVTCDDERYYELHGRPCISGAKYFALWRLLTGKSYV